MLCAYATWQRLSAVLPALTPTVICRAILLKRFMQPPQPPGDAFAHVGSILVNLTRLKAARTLLLQPGRGLLGALQTQLHSPELLRRQGAAGTLRNVCFSAEVRPSVGLALPRAAQRAAVC